MSPKAHSGRAGRPTYGAFDLMRHVTARGWHFRLRLHSCTYVRRPGEARWRKLRDLAPEEGERRYLQGVELTKDR